LVWIRTQYIAVVLRHGIPGILKSFKSRRSAP
jgi:hypothetical protein